MDALGTIVRVGSKQPETGVLDEDPDPDPGIIHEVPDHARLAAAMECLPEQWQLALWHVEVLGRTAAEMSALLGVDAAAADELLLQARNALRGAYGQHHAKTFKE